MPTPTLPYDVLHNIFGDDDISNDKSLLKDCSLVCHLWTLATSPYLFRRLRLIVSEHMKYTFRNSAVEQFSDLVTKLRRSGRINSAVQELELQAYPGGYPNGSFACPVAMLQELICTLPRLQILELFSIDFYPTPEVSIDYDPTKLRSIDRLGFWILNESNQHVAHILRLFDTIGELRIGACHSNSLEVDLTDRRPVRVKGITVQSYRKDKDEHRNLLELLSAILDFSSLTQIVFKIQVRSTFAQIFTKCHALEVLDLSEVTAPEMRPDCWRSKTPCFHLDLSPCTRLRILRLLEYRLLFRTPHSSDPPDPLRWQLIRNYLSSIPDENNLEILEFTISFEFDTTMSLFYPDSWPAVGDVEQDLSAADWDVFDRELCRFKRLRQISFVLQEACPRGEEFIRVMQQMLSEWVRRRTYVYRCITFHRQRSTYRPPEHVKEEIYDEVDRTLQVAGEGPVTVYDTDERGFQILRLSK